MADGPHGTEEKAPLLKGWMIVAIVAIIGLSAVGITALVVSHSPSTTTSSTTVASIVQTTVTTTTVPVTTTAPASLTNFVGTWSMHDGGLVIAASGVGSVTIPGQMYGGCGQTAQIQVSPASATTALVTITAIEPPTCPGVAGGFNPSGGGGPNEELSAGSAFTITIAPPGVHTSWGINYCDQAHAAQQVCGA
jgi:hypothetical protein